MTLANLRGHAERIRCARAVFLDWDGCLVQDGALLPGVADFLGEVGDRAWILSNNSTDLPATFVEMLARAGVEMSPERVLLAGDVAVTLTASRPNLGPVHMVAAARMKVRARSLGIELDSDGREAGVVLLLRDTQFSYARLNRAVAALRRGARLVVANTDRTHPTRTGVVPETGALLASIAACVDLDTVEVQIVGKPGPLLFQTALERARLSPAEAVMIGDNPETDVVGAELLGIPAICLSHETGVTIETLAQALIARPHPEYARR